MTKYAVKGRTRIGKELTIRNFDDWDDAAEHALCVNMKHWDDVWIEKVKPSNSRHMSVEPPLPPFEVMEDYLIDANKRKVAALLGTREVKEAFASMLIGAFDAK